MVSPSVSPDLLAELDRGSRKDNTLLFVCPVPREANGALMVGGSVLSCYLQSAGTMAMKEILLAEETPGRMRRCPPNPTIMYFM